MLTRRRAAVLGSPVAHSLSPVMHRAAYAHLGLAGWSYERAEVPAGGLEAHLAGLDDTWRGLSVTMPLKEEALRLAATADPVARRVGGANTLVRRPDGRWDAANTDVYGVREALAAHDVTAARRVALLGSGATARSALVAVHEIGAREVDVVVRGEIRQPTAVLARELGMQVRVHGPSEVAAVVAPADLVVDTLPGSAADPLAGVLAGTEGLPPLFEAIYEGWPTALARVFLGGGSTVVSGLDMLAHQAVAQVRLMTGHEVPVEVLLDAARAALD